MTSNFDTLLLDFGDEPKVTETANTNSSSDPFDLFSTVEQNGGSDSGCGGNGALLDLGFDAPISSQHNGDSGKVSFEANTNPLYDFQNSSSDIKMSSEPVNPLFELSSETQVPEKPVEKSANPLYDLDMNEPEIKKGEQNGHGEDSLINGATNGDVEIQDNTENLVSEDSGVTMDTQATNDAGETTLDEGDEEEQVQEEVPVDIQQEEEEQVEDQNKPTPASEAAGQPETETEVAGQQGQQDGDGDQTIDEPTKQESATVNEAAADKTEDTPAQAEPESEPIAQPEQPTEPEKPTEPESEPIAQSEQPTEAVSEPIAQPEKPTEAESEPIAQPEKPTEPESEPIAQPEKPTEPESEPIVQPEQPIEPEQPTEPENPTESEKATEVEVESEPVPTTDAQVEPEQPAELQSEPELQSESTEQQQEPAVVSDAPAESQALSEPVEEEVEEKVAESQEQTPVAEEVASKEEVAVESQEQTPVVEETASKEEVVETEQQQESQPEETRAAPEPEQASEPTEPSQVTEPASDDQQVTSQPGPVAETVAEPVTEAVAETEEVPEAKAESEPVTEEVTESEPVAQAEEALQEEDSEATQAETEVVEDQATTTEPLQTEEEPLQTEDQPPQTEDQPPQTKDQPPQTEDIAEQPMAEKQAPVAPVTEDQDVKVEPAVSIEETKVEPVQEEQQELPLVQTFKSTSYVILSPSAPPQTMFGYTQEPEQTPAVQVQVKETEPVVASPDVTENAVNGTSVSQNGVEDDVERDPNIVRETGDREEVPQFEQMSSVREKFESGSSSDQIKKRFSIKDEIAEGGEYESTPVVDPEVVRESDRNIGEELPEVGMAKNILSKFKEIEQESAKPKTGRQASPPKQTGQSEYVSEPATSLEQYQGQSESGEFESQPQHNEGVIRSGEKTEEDSLPEKGYTKNLAHKFKEYEAEAARVKTTEKKEMTPDRSGKVEFVSEPRGQVEHYAGQPDSGVFESQPREDEEEVVKSSEMAPEVLPETGMAKNLLSRFKQMETEVVNYPPPSPKRETPVKRTPEQRGYLEKYEPQEGESIESDPVQREIVRSEDIGEEVLPEAGTAKKTLERFKEIQKQSTSPGSKTKKEFTPPRDSSPGRTVGVLENEPVERQEGVVKSTDMYEAELPEKGMAKNILNRFKQIEVERGATSPVRGKKEFTPPPDAGVYENTPSERLTVEEQKSESGLLESQPTPRCEDIAREDQVSLEQELPERGYAKNLVSKFRQIESESAKQSSSTSPKFKEFTPPRDTKGLLSPKSPVAGFEGVSPSDLPAQYQEQTAAGVFENQPESLTDVAREADTDYNEGLPAANTTMSMLEKFRGIQKKAQDDQESPKPISRKESQVKKTKDDTPSPEPEEGTVGQNGVDDKGMFIAVETEKCAACQKTVYAMEKLEMNKHVYHRACFKCSHCSTRLTPKQFSMNEGVIYCTTHFKQLFARKGNYDEGFGRQQYKKKWTGDVKKEDSS